MYYFNHHYQSDISRQQFDLICQDLAIPRKRTQQKHIDPYDVFGVMFHALKKDCTRRDCRLIYAYCYWM